ncbi:MAG: prolyl oligopeptidase family serine peptidase [Longimicrobiales bacterium]|nr:prolyl oligopeptidase family serine peptidase [Longimicrobiales bacterium]
MMPHARRPHLALALLGGLLALGADALSAQVPASTPVGRVLDHADYDRWMRIANSTISPDGRWIAWREIPGSEEPWATLHIRNVESGATLEIRGGDEPTFTDDSKWLVTLAAPDPAAVEEAEEAAEEDEGVVVPQATLQIVSLAEMAVVESVAEIDDFRVPAEGSSVVAMRRTKEADDREEKAGEEPPATEEPAEEEPAEADESAEAGDEEADGQTLLVVRLDGDRTPIRVDDVTDYAFTHEGGALYYATNDDAETDGVYRMRIDDGASTALLSGAGRYLNLAVSAGDEGTGDVAFLSDAAEGGAEASGLALHVAGRDDDRARLLVETTHAAFPEGWGVSEHGDLRFSDAGTRVFFGTRPLPDPEAEEDPEEDDEAENEVEVDVWNWKDDYLQPMQLIEAREYDERTWEAAARVDGAGVLQLEDEFFENTQVADGGDGPVALSRVSRPWRQLLSWDGRYYDYYLFDLATETRERVLERLDAFVSFTPGDHDLVWWDGGERQWRLMERETRVVTNLTAAVPHPVHDELDDHPQDPRSYGSAGWTEDGRFLVYDRYDIWAVDPAGGAPSNLTEGVGRANRIEFRYQSIEPDAEYVPGEGEVYLRAFHELEKSGGWYRDDFGGTDRPEPLVFTAHRYGTPQKAEDADRFLLTRESFRDFPDLYTTDGSMASFERHSDANPQQAEYRWGSSEIFEWTSADGVPLQGILYKPDGFDPDETYPMMVYFYERSSDGLHSHHIPSAGSSSINRSFYVSRGYLLFVPDIPYEIGFPGESAEDAVIPGVLALIDEGFVDADAIGVQGHSWGGYQIAHMITRSDIFAAAEAGAPVVNMTSAYGGIRWGSGMSRAFQYEKTQSRIGGTLWDAHQRYIENSPLFFADKIRTPLLMMHNDEDGAVPWYQGIEMFSAMRRLGKPVWMLNYNGEAHGLRQEANQRDWAIRMQQFFDHYLVDAPPPVWLEEGVPATMKGKTLGLDLVTPPIATEEGAAGSR